ncbi:hypothetical protein VOLCADRAFT_86334 [Volvox carteri f. nagariensis]|uniref:SET domain-containing protein n=1 Tax=Volvox carteri f. nagariensis TaxID=3068 RepID=D8TIH9_VOLCA|nr:uncharacterized protein VOLCADRAFT_86334 [Volvox carteri f. nagariensis]EFJ53244.1 hypothetical protein VOLCADRAFT_86334 [Volvox carteri f. nagariensis]|eukprot:XP_002946249.1 hypothetical protein VOLCADRAFT_86334 [Volvox carteri f. nagariensis]
MAKRECLLTGVELRDMGSKGLGFVASGPLQTGTVAIQERPYATSLFPQAYAVTCRTCFGSINTATKGLQSCRRSAFYCSYKCATLDRRAHRDSGECWLYEHAAGLSLAAPLGLQREAILALRHLLLFPPVSASTTAVATATTTAITTATATAATTAVSPAAPPCCSPSAPAPAPAPYSSNPIRQPQHQHQPLSCHEAHLAAGSQVERELASWQAAAVASAVLQPGSGSLERGLSGEGVSGGLDGEVAEAAVAEAEAVAEAAGLGPVPVSCGGGGFPAASNKTRPAAAGVAGPPPSSSTSSESSYESSSSSDDGGVPPHRDQRYCRRRRGNGSNKADDALRAILQLQSIFETWPPYECRAVKSMQPAHGGGGPSRSPVHNDSEAARGGSCGQGQRGRGWDQEGEEGEEEEGERRHVGRRSVTAAAAAAVGVAAAAVATVLSNALEVTLHPPFAVGLIGAGRTTAAAAAAAGPLSVPLALYRSACRINHSCRPTAAYHFRPGAQIRVRLLADLDDGAEITVSYVDLALPRSRRRAQLRDQYGFDCCCERCCGCSASAGRDGGGWAADPSVLKSVAAATADELLGASRQPAAPASVSDGAATAAASAAWSAAAAPAAVAELSLEQRLQLLVRDCGDMLLWQPPPPPRPPPPPQHHHHHQRQGGGGSSTAERAFSALIRGLDELLEEAKCAPAPAPAPVSRGTLGGKWGGRAATTTTVNATPTAADLQLSIGEVVPGPGPGPGFAAGGPSGGGDDGGGDDGGASGPASMFRPQQHAAGLDAFALLASAARRCARVATFAAAAATASPGPDEAAAAAADGERPRKGAEEAGKDGDVGGGPAEGLGRAVGVSWWARAVCASLAGAAAAERLLAADPALLQLAAASWSDAASTVCEMLSEIFAAAMPDAVDPPATATATATTATATAATATAATAAAPSPAAAGPSAGPSRGCPCEELHKVWNPCRHSGQQCTGPAAAGRSAAVTVAAAGVPSRYHGGGGGSSGGGGGGGGGVATTTTMVMTTTATVRSFSGGGERRWSWSELVMCGANGGISAAGAAGAAGEAGEARSGGGSVEAAPGAGWLVMMIMMITVIMTGGIVNATGSGEDMDLSRGGTPRGRGRSREGLEGTVMAQTAVPTSALLVGGVRWRRLGAPACTAAACGAVFRVCRRLGEEEDLGGGPGELGPRAGDRHQPGVAAVAAAALDDWLGGVGLSPSSLAAEDADMGSPASCGTGAAAAEARRREERYGGGGDAAATAASAVEAAAGVVAVAAAHSLARVHLLLRVLLGEAHGACEAAQFLPFFVQHLPYEVAAELTQLASALLNRVHVPYVPL